MVNSKEYDGMAADACKSKIIQDLEAGGTGKGAVNYNPRLDFLTQRLLENPYR